ncbi:MAG: CSLREA domain-containing protein [Gammaproteobacteria bacterium]
MMARAIVGYRRTVLTALTTAVLLGLCAPAFGAFYRITEFADDNVVNGNCTLREAIRAANTNAAVDDCSAGSSTSRDVIFLQAGMYTLDLLNGTSEDNAVNGDLDVSGDLLIAGVSADYTIITGATVQTSERMFDIANADAALVLNFDPQFIAQRFATFCVLTNTLP